MNYRIDGKEGRPWIVFSNSLGTDMSMWDDQVEFLKNDFHILRYHTLGTGRTSIEDLGRDVLTLMDTLEISTAHFCGISLGGLIGQWLAINASERFLSFTFSNTSPLIGSSLGWQQRVELVKKEGLALVRAGSPQRWFSQGFCERHPSKVNKVLSGFDQTDAKDYMSLCEILGKTDLWSELRKITKPVLIFAGELDTVTTVKEAHQMKEKIPHAQLKILKASHLANIEDQTFSEELCSHLKAMK